MLASRFNRPAVAPVVQKTPLTLIASKSLEGFVDGLHVRYPSLAIESLTPALETQQLDNSARQAALDEVKETLDKYDEEHPHTGPLQVYLLDGQGMAMMDQEGEASPLKALVNAAMRNPSRTVAALLPEDRTVSRVEQLSPNTLLRQLTDTVLSVEGVHVLVGAEALEAFLQQPELTPSMEGIFGDAIKGVRRFLSKNPTNPDYHPTDTRIDISPYLTSQFRKTYLKPSWLKVQKFKDTVPANAIVRDIIIKGVPVAPAELANALKHTSDIFKSFLDDLTGHYRHYVGELAKLGEELRSGGDAAAIDKKVKALKNPIVQTDLKKPLDGLASPRIVVTDDDVQVWRFRQKDEDAASLPKTLPGIKAEEMPAIAQADIVFIETIFKDLYAALKTAWKSPEEEAVVKIVEYGPLVAKMGPEFKKEAKRITSGYYLGWLADYMQSLLITGNAVDRWLYRSVGKKDVLATESFKDEVAEGEPAKEGSDATSDLPDDVKPKEE